MNNPKSLNINQYSATYDRPTPGFNDAEIWCFEVESVYEALKKSLGSKDEVYFIVAVHPEHQSQAVCGWIKKGECKTLQTSGKQLRLHFAGAISLNNMNVFVKEYETVDADAMVDFLTQLEKQSEAPRIHVILDNARANKNKKLEEFLKTSRIIIHYLPPYSPNLNPIERLWKILRETTLYNTYYETSWACFKKIRWIFSEGILEMIDVLKLRINDNFQTIHLNPIKIV